MTHSVFLILLISLVLISGCGTQQIKLTGGAAGDLLPKPGATIEIGDITLEAEKESDFDPAVILEEALVKALKEEQLLWTGDNTPRFLLNVRIVDYEPGNAFKRWVLPGWGSTVLVVRGEIQTPENGTVAAMIENKRSVFAGGGYTIGAWESIFGNVAADLVHEIKARINGGGFMVSLTPYSEQSSGANQTKNPLEIKIESISDLRADKLRLGERTAAFDVQMSDIYPNRRVNEYLIETLSDALRIMGHKVGPSANGVTVQGQLHKFWVETPATMLYWDVTAEIELMLLLKGPEFESGMTRSYASKKKKRTYAWPSESLIEKVIHESISDIVSQIQGDEIWSKLASDMR